MDGKLHVRENVVPEVILHIKGSSIKDICTKGIEERYDRMQTKAINGGGSFSMCLRPQHSITSRLQKLVELYQQTVFSLALTLNE